MSQRRKKPQFSIEFGGQEYTARPDNAMAYLHQDNLLFDHIYIHQENDADKTPQGIFVFRESVANYVELVNYMEDSGYAVIHPEHADEGDKTVYIEWIKSMPVDPMPELAPLLPRHERIAQYFAYLLNQPNATSEF